MCGGFYRQLVWDDLTWRMDILSDVERACPLSLVANRTLPGYTKAEWRPSAHAGVSAVWILAAARMRQTESTGLGSHLFWPGFHIRMNAYVQVNENPGGNSNPSARRMNLFPSDFLEQPGAREIPIIIKGGQRNSKDPRCLLVGHASEITQFDQFGLNGILDA